MTMPTRKKATLTLGVDMSILNSKAAQTEKLGSIVSAIFAYT